MEKVNLVDKLALFNEYWSPRIVGRVNDHELKLAKVKGEFVWHHHEEADEMFLVIRGKLTIKLRDGEVRLAPGELFIVPKGVEHKPVAEEEAHVLLLEPKGTLNTGNVTGEHTTFRPEYI